MTSHQTLCQQVEDSLSAYADGELSPLEATGTEAHLRECASCRTLFEGQMAISSLLQSAGRRTPPPPPWSSLDARLENHRRRAKRLRRSKLLLLAAALAIAAGAGWLVAGRGPAARGPTASGPTGRSPAQIESSPGHRQDPAAAGELKPRLAGFGLPGLDWFLNQHRAVEIDLDGGERNRLSFEPQIHQRLPGGFELARAYRIHDSCGAGICLIYRDASHQLVGLVQQPPAHPVVWKGARFTRQLIAGVGCRRARLPEVELAQVDPDGRNLTLVVARGFPGVDELVRHLASH